MNGGGFVGIIGNNVLIEKKRKLSVFVINNNS